MIRAKVFARVGELIQGKLGIEEHVIIPGIMSSQLYTETFIDVVPVGEELKPKLKIVLELFLKVLEGKPISTLNIDSLEIPENRLLENKYFITQVSNIPFGKGYTSKSADCLSLLKALNHFYEAELAKEVLYQIASKVTVVDPCLEMEINQIFDPLNGARVFNLPEVELGCLYFDSNIDQVSNPEVVYTNLNYNSEEETRLEALLATFQEGLVTGEMKAIYAATLESAKINQRFNPKTKLDLLIEFAENHQIGVFVSHVGSVMGVIGEPSKLESLSNEFESFCNLHWQTIIASSCIKTEESFATLV